MPKTINFDSIKAGITTYQAYRSEFENIIKIRLKARIRILMGINQIKRERLFQKKLDHISDDNWKVFWSRLYSDPVQIDNMPEWLLKNGMDLFIITASKKEREMAFSAINGIYKKSLINYVKDIIERYYTDKMALHQKSREIAEKTIYKVILNLNLYNPYKAGLMTWIFNIAKNTALTPGKKTDEKTHYILDQEESDEGAIEGVKLDFFKSNDPVPDELYAKAAMGKAIFQILFETSGYPWQTLCVGFMKMSYKPGDIIEKFSESTIKDMFEAFKIDFFSLTFRSEEEVNELLKILEDSIDKPIKEIILNHDSKTKKTLAGLLEKTCGNVKLKDFFGNSPNKNISDWNARTLIRLRKELKERRII